MPPPLPPHDRRMGQQISNQYSDQVKNIISGSNLNENSRINRYSRNSAATPGLSLYNNNNNNNGLLNANSNSTDQLQGYGDTQTLRADDSRLQFIETAVAMNKQHQFSSSGMNEHQAGDNSTTQTKQSAEPMAMSVSLTIWLNS